MLSVTLRGEHIQGSPYNLVAGAGFISDYLAQPKAARNGAEGAEGPSLQAQPSLQPSLRNAARGAGQRAAPPPPVHVVHVDAALAATRQRALHRRQLSAPTVDPVPSVSVPTSPPLYVGRPWSRASSPPRSRGTGSAGARLLEEWLEDCGTAAEAGGESGGGAAGLHSRRPIYSAAAALPQPPEDAPPTSHGAADSAPQATPPRESPPARRVGSALPTAPPTASSPKTLRPERPRATNAARRATAAAQTRAALAIRPGEKRR